MENIIPVWYKLLWLVVASTPPLLLLGGAAPVIISPAPHLSTADQRTSKSAASTGSSQRDIGIRVVCMRWHVKRWFVLYVFVQYRVDTLVLIVCVSSEISCSYSINSGYCLLLVAQEFFLCTCSVRSCAFIFGGVSFITFLFVLFCRWLCINAACMRFMLFFTVCKVAVSGVVSLVVVVVM